MDGSAGSGKYRELTAASILGGILVGILLNMGIVYAGMQIGFGIVGSTVGAILGFGLLRGILRQGSILEVNIFQTIASSVNTVNAGVIFTVPVLFLLGLEEDISYTAIMLATIGGSVLGVVMIIPLRKQIIEFERLRFPSAVGVAAILKSPGAGEEKARLLIGGILVSATVTFLTNSWGPIPSVIPGYFNVGEMLNVLPGFRLVFAVSLLSLGAGYLAGRPGLAVLYGTLLNFWFLIPVCVALGWVPAGFENFSLTSTGNYGDDSAFTYAGKFNGAFAHYTSRHVGIGMILGGALAGIVIALPALKAALASLKTSQVGEGRQEEMSIRAITSGLFIGFALLLVSTKLAGGEILGWGTIFIATIAGAFWLGLAGLVVAQTTGRTDWSPLSGLALIAIAIMMGIMGTSREYIIPAVTMGAAICVATSMCADMMADLKTGYLVGGRPLSQQTAQVATCWIGPGVALITVVLLWNAYGFGPNQAEILHERANANGELAAYLEAGGTKETVPPGTPVLLAPQAGALEAAINIVQSGDVAIGKYIAGAILGILVSLLISPGLGVMVGLSLYLPFEYMIVFGSGGIINILVTKFKGARFAEEKGVPIAAGLIVGDALVGVANAILEVARSQL